MKRYLLSIYQPEGDPPPPEVLEKVMRDVDAVNQELKAAGAWVFAGGLRAPSAATVVRLLDGDVLRHRQLGYLPAGLAQIYAILGHRQLMQRSYGCGSAAGSMHKKCPQSFRPYAAAPTPVTSFHTWDRTARSARYSSAFNRCRRGQKCPRIASKAERKRWVCPSALTLCITRSRLLVGWWQFSAQLFR